MSYLSLRVTTNVAAVLYKQAGTPVVAGGL